MLPIARLLVAMLLLLSAALVHAQAATSATETALSLPTLSVILNFYGLEQAERMTPAVEAIAPFVRPGDVFVLVSGNRKGRPNLFLVARWSKHLHERFPKNEIWVLTSGLANVRILADARAQIQPQVTTIVYDYEPNWDNEPEFDADFGKTLANFTQAATLAHNAGFALVGAPTGRPLLQGAFARYGWDYGNLARESSADGMLVQTQTYGKKGIEDFASALARLKIQQTGAGLPLDRVYPQITVDPNASNGVPVAQALACIREAQRAGFRRVSLWFAPARVEHAVDFLKGLRP